MLTSGRTVVDRVDGGDVAAHGLQDAARHFVADVASWPSVRHFCETCCYSPMDYLPRLLETRCIARMTLTWLAMARTRVSGRRASVVMAAQVRLCSSSAARQQKKSMAARGIHSTVDM